jgi:predicted transcriptional regulator
MAKGDLPPLSRRERQIMDVLYRQGESTAADVRSGLTDAPSYSTVRTLLRVLLDKGHVRHKESGPRYVYFPTVPRQQARRRALQDLLATFFEGSPEKAMATLVDMASTNLSPDEVSRIQSLVEQARRKGERR